MAFAPDNRQRPGLPRAPAAGLLCLWAMLPGWVLPAHPGAAGPAWNPPAPGKAAQETLEPEEAELDYLGLAEGHRQAREYLQAISAYQLALIEDPHNPVAWFGLGLSQYEAGQVQEAIGSYREALKNDPDLWEAEMNLGVIWFNRKNPGQALVHFERAQVLNPESWRPFFLAGEVHRLRDNLTEAETSYRQALDLTRAGDEQALIHAALVSVYLGKKDYGGAARHVMASRPHATDMEASDRQLAALYLEMGQEEKALPYLERLAAAPSAGPELHETIGWMRVDRKDYDRGIQALEIALERQPDPGRREKLSLQIAKLHVRLEQFDEAVALLEKGLPGSVNPERYFLLGSLHLQADRLEPAGKRLAQALHLDADCAQCYNKLAAIYLKQEDFGRAIPLLDRYRELQPEEAMTYFYLGVAYDRLRHYGKAIPLYEKFLELDQGRHDRESFQVGQRLKGLKKRAGRR
ncbi:MAG: tetratricopeptide repeat protein [Acidobacteria bacterium]|nr:tetratricopeptide repeat protein [Acidobacteriota bacterium]